MAHHLGGLESRRMLVLLLKAGAAGLALAAVCVASKHWLLAEWATQPFVYKAVMLLGTVLVGAAAFGVAGMALRIEELTELVGQIQRRLRRGRSGFA